MPEDIDNELKGRQPYREWLKANAVSSTCRSPGR